VRISIAYRLHAALERRLPERRVYLRTDRDTRFTRVSPGAQLGAIAGGSAVLAWTVVATAIVLMDGIGSGGAREQAQREQATYEARLEELSTERDARAREARGAETRFDEAMEQLGRMQSALLDSQTRVREMEAAFEIASERTRGARRALAEAEERLAALDGGETGPAAVDDAAMDILVATLGDTAEERDRLAVVADGAEAREAELLAEAEAVAERNDLIFAQLEEAMTVSVEPLERMFAAAGHDPDAILRAVRRGYSGQGGPLTPIVSSMGPSDAVADRANAILEGMHEMDLYRRAAETHPFADPVPSNAYRQTSGFGPRRDPFGRGTRMHNGLDFAGARGTPIHATAEGRVSRAGWMSGYGKTIDVDHGNGYVTRYAHLSSIEATVGQRVSRGERIGGMGTTGRSTGVHLHYEVRRNGEPVNPMTYIKAARDVF
jgi:murein DD-endopeptidase MepM/ murein hydrolase activator NlpD